MGKRSPPALPRPAWIGSLPGGGGHILRSSCGGLGVGAGGWGWGVRPLLSLQGGGPDRICACGVKHPSPEATEELVSAVVLSPDGRGAASLGSTSGVGSASTVPSPATPLSPSSGRPASGAVGSTVGGAMPSLGSSRTIRQFLLPLVGAVAAVGLVVSSPVLATSGGGGGFVVSSSCSMPSSEESPEEEELSAEESDWSGFAPRFPPAVPRCVLCLTISGAGFGGGFLGPVRFSQASLGQTSFVLMETPPMSREG